MKIISQFKLLSFCVVCFLSAEVMASNSNNAASIDLKEQNEYGHNVHDAKRNKLIKRLETAIPSLPTEMMPIIASYIPFYIWKKGSVLPAISPDRVQSIIGVSSKKIAVSY